MDDTSLDYEQLVLHDLVSKLEKLKPADTPILDVNNLLIAINGVDSSALDGQKTVVHSGDTISIIPVIHGGAKPLSIQNNNIEIFFISGDENLDYKFLDSLRARHPKITIQAISAKFVLSISHIKKILAISLVSQKRKILLAEKLETDILLRFAGTTQISKAIKDLGIKPKKDFVLVAVGRSNLSALRDELQNTSKIKLEPNVPFIKRYHHISQKHLDVISSSTPLEDLLQERASVLF